MLNRWCGDERGFAARIVFSDGAVAFGPAEAVPLLQSFSDWQRLFGMAEAMPGYETTVPTSNIRT
jgi:hypothetical protein